MSLFAVTLPAQSPDVADLCQALGEAGVNVVLSLARHRGDLVMVLVADDVAVARGVLADSDVRHGEYPALTLRLPHVPGAGSHVLQQLVRARIEVWYFLPVLVSDADFYAVLCVDDPVAARAVLGDRVVTD